MKTVFLLTLALLFSQAHGAPKTFKNKKMTAKEVREFIQKNVKHNLSPVQMSKRSGSSPANPNPNPILIPIRTAAFKAEIYRMEIKKLPDGTYAMSWIDICTVKGAAEVYDVGSTSGWNLPDPKLEECQSTVDGVTSTVKVGGFWLLQEGPIFPDESAITLKQGVGHLEVSAPLMALETVGLIGATRDLDTESLFGFMGGNFYQTCHDDGSGGTICDPPQGDFFMSILELQD